MKAPWQSVHPGNVECPVLGRTIVWTDTLWWTAQRDNLFFPAWVFGLPTTILRIPYSLLESSIYTCVTYYVVGLAPEPSRFFSCASP